KIAILTLVAFLIIFNQTTTLAFESDLSLDSDILKVKKISAHTYRHISFLQTESWGKVACNGLIIVENGKAVILDTPVDNESSKQLINYLQSKGIEIKVIVPTHFHEDCVGGLSEFKKEAIPIYISQRTLKLLGTKKDYSNYDFSTFENELKLEIQDGIVQIDYLGAGHTTDNVVAYYNKDQVLFGGCLVKELGASKGNLDDANISEWSNTVRKVKAHYPKTKIVVPGHGKFGGTELLDFTIKLFEGEEK
ncbi:subclass B1 metallo-beta-lactamase, partial [bacterium]